MFKDTGQDGEYIAAAYLEKEGYKILARNFHTRQGELDIVCQFNEELVFVEVKTRSSRAFGLPEEAVTRRKQAHMLAAAQSSLQQHPELEGSWRIDVIAIQRYEPSRPPTIYHFENAIS